MRNARPLLAWLVALSVPAGAARASCPRCANASLAPAVRSIGTDLVYASSAAVADFNGDGIPDVAVRNSEAIAVFLGRGAGNFTPALVTPVKDVDLNVQIAVGDFNEDGRPDLAVGIFGKGLAILLGGGNGRFFVQPDLPGGAVPMAIGVGDVDGDGHLDVVGVSANGDVTMFRGNGHGGASPVYVVPTGRSAFTASLGVGDLNADGYADVAVTFGYPGLAVLMGSPSGPSLPVLLDDFDGHGAVLIADATGDGKLDVLASTPRSENTILFPGDGAGGFGAPVAFPVGGAPSSYAVADLDGDGTPDLAAVSYQYNTLDVRLGDGAGGFGPARSFFFGFGPGTLAVADLDGDGIPDFVSGNGYSVSIGMGDGTGGVAVRTVAAGESPTSIALADLDGDGTLDALTTNFAFPSFLSIFHGLGGGNFAPPSVASGYPQPLFIVAADFTGDGKPDVVITNFEDSTFTALVNAGNGTFVTSKTLPIGCSPASRPVVEDLDGDGYGDVSYACDDSVRIRFGDGLGGFSAPISVPVTARWLAVGDVNGDGHPDLVSTGPFSGQVYVCLGDGLGNFGSPIPTDLPHGSAYGLVLADFDGDGKLDFATSGSSNGQFLDVVYGDGTGRFGRPLSFPMGPFASVTLAADLNGDGRPDVVAQGLGVGVLMNDGSGSFLPLRTFATGGNPDVAVGDVDGDGLMDLVATDQSRGVFSVLLNTSCKARRLAFLPSTNACTPAGVPLAPAPAVEVLDDGGNLVLCATGSVTAAVKEGIPGAVLSGTKTEPVASGVATFPDLRLDLPGAYRLGFTHSGGATPAAGGVSVGSGVSVSIAGPPLLCGSDPAVYDAGAGFASYVWLLDGAPVGFSRIFAAPFLGAGPHTLSAFASLGGCEGSASRAISNLPPTASSISPTTGSRGGFTPVQVTGTCIASGAALTLGGRAAHAVTAPVSTLIRGTTPREPPGVVDVVVTNPDGQAATLPGAFTYLSGTSAVPLTPCRVLDTRLPNGLLGGPVLPARGTRLFTVTGACGIPDGAVAIIVNATVTQPAAAGGLVLQAAGIPGSGEFLTFSAGQTRANNGLLILPFDESGAIFAFNNSAGTTHFILDVAGYFY